MANKPTIAASIPLVDEWPKSRVDAMDAEQQARAGSFEVHVPSPKELADAEAQLQRSASNVPRPRALRGSR